MKPDDIERTSFEIIDREAGRHHYSEQQWCIVRRMIHTTADFDFKEMVLFTGLQMGFAMPFCILFDSRGWKNTRTKLLFMV